MKFLLDVHVSTSVARAIQTLGYDVVRAALEYATWPDDKLLALAVEKDWILVSQDGDFTDLIFAYGAAAPPSLIYMRCEPEVQPLMADRVTEIILDNRLIGNLVVLKPQNNRYRPFPKLDKEND